MPTGGIKLLGAPIGDATFCAQLTSKRVTKAQELLNSMDKYGHSQGALLMLRHCAGWGKLVYAARTVPPALHRDALEPYGVALRRSLEHLAGDRLPERSWSLAQVGVSHGGLGVRDPARHAPAAYLASLRQSRDLCRRLDPDFDAEDKDGGSFLRDTERVLKASVLEGASWDRGDAAPSQKELSGMLDAAAMKQLLEGHAQDAAFRAHVGLCQLPGAGAWLTANPVADGRELDAPLFRVALQRRLRMPILDKDEYCPCCGGVMDTWGDHAIVCPCGGDRTIRHNAVHNVCFEEADGASLRPEREKAGLLPPRPEADELPAGASGGRRPADVWLPRGSSGKGEALDFAVSSAMRGDLLRQTAETPEAIFAIYDRQKREHLNTGQQCQAAGFNFIPMVLEAHAGGWSPTARRILDWIALQAAAAQHESPTICTLKVAQRTSCTLQRENARAILKRVVRGDTAQQPSGWAAAGPSL
jgi:hypothetical protein